MIIQIFSSTDRYMERPSATSWNGKYSVLNNFCYAEILANLTLENKSNKTYEHESNELDDNLIENNQE